MPAVWRAPKRPEHKITQDYNDGFVTLYRVEDEAAPGYLPREKLKELVGLPYSNRRVGVQRYYAAEQNQSKVQRVIRVPHPPMKLTNRDKAVTEDGEEYRVDLVQFVPDVWPLSDDVTLVAYRQGAAV